MIIPAVVSFIVALVWGMHIRFKVTQGYVVSGILLALLLGSYIYYNNMISLVYVAAVLGVTIGAHIGGGNCE